MQIHPLKLGLPFVLLALPLLHTWSRADDTTPWLLALGVYVLASVITMARYQPVAYRTGVPALWGQFALNLFVAGAFAVGYTLAATGGIGAVLKLFS